MSLALIKVSVQSMSECISTVLTPRIDVNYEVGSVSAVHRSGFDISDRRPCYDQMVFRVMLTPLKCFSKLWQTVLNAWRTLCTDSSKASVWATLTGMVTAESLVSPA